MLADGVRLDRQEGARADMERQHLAADTAFVVWLRDISSTGALIAGETRLPTDCDVIFKRGPIFAAAKVAWSNDTGAGLEFYRNLDKYEIASAELPLPNRED